ncbi:MAG: hypothetical protein HY456_03260 [Parcubacteria group bacterium]|nr:hypothetical protein [Parcubacteria group bacterium]
MPRFSRFKNKNELTLLLINASMLLLTIAISGAILGFIVRSLNSAINTHPAQVAPTVHFNLEKAKGLGL